MTQKAAIRRRRQAKMGFTHIARLGRPIYPCVVSKEKAKEKLARMLHKQQEMQNRAKGKKK